jgi:hypothetical protein
MMKRRNQHYVDHEVQSSLARRLACHWMALMLASGLGILFWTRLIEAPMESWDVVIRTAAGHFIPFAIIAMVLIPVFLRDAMRLSNRFAGPIVRVRRVLSDLAEGKTPRPVEFRQGDFWKSLANDLNRVVMKSAPTDKQP